MRHDLQRFGLSFGFQANGRGFAFRFQNLGRWNKEGGGNEEEKDGCIGVWKKDEERERERTRVRILGRTFDIS